MSTVAILENLVKFIEANKQRIIKKETTICTDKDGTRSRKALPCETKNADDEYLIKCENCPFYTVENADETIRILNDEVIKEEKIYAALRGE